MRQPTLLILAAGMGNRYGGLKQIDPVGPHGETIIDYSIYDAIRAGFGKLVFVIRQGFEEAFKAKIGEKLQDRIQVEYAFQEVDNLPEGFEAPGGRERPWGTGHACLVARDAISEPFGVINADDFYGAKSFRLMAQCLTDDRMVHHDPDSDFDEFAMVGFVLRQTLSDYGAVSRGVCELGEGDFLRKVTERTQITRRGQGGAYVDADGNVCPLGGDEIVSMNMWGFTPGIFSHLHRGFVDFLRRRVDEPKSEFFLPAEVDDLIHAGKARVHVVKSDDQWFGVTYRQDIELVQASIRRLVEEGLYPERLWS